MKTIWIINHNNNLKEYYENKEDAIRHINTICDIYREARKQQKVTLIYEPYRDAFESNSRIYDYFVEIQFANRPKLFIKLEKATLH